VQQQSGTLMLLLLNMQLLHKHLLLLLRRRRWRLRLLQTSLKAVLSHQHNQQCLCWVLLWMHRALLEQLLLAWLLHWVQWKPLLPQQ
jgi:hypothetical protein